jgi:hypothetical protein
MSTNVTATPVPLPAPLRILSADEYDAAVKAAVRAARSVKRATVAEIANAVLAEVGLFSPPDEPDELDPEFCTSQCLPFDAEEAAAGMLGVWQQCGDEPGHDGNGHDSGEFSWTDGMPGTVPAQQTQET